MKPGDSKNIIKNKKFITIYLSSGQRELKINISTSTLRTVLENKYGENAAWCNLSCVGIVGYTPQLKQPIGGKPFEKSDFPENTNFEKEIFNLGRTDYHNATEDDFESYRPSFEYNYDSPESRNFYANWIEKLMENNPEATFLFIEGAGGVSLNKFGREMHQKYKDNNKVHFGLSCSCCAPLLLEVHDDGSFITMKEEFTCCIPMTEEFHYYNPRNERILELMLIEHYVAILEVLEEAGSNVAKYYKIDEDSLNKNHYSEYLEKQHGMLGIETFLTKEIMLPNIENTHKNRIEKIEQKSLKSKEGSACLQSC